MTLLLLFSAVLCLRMYAQYTGGRSAFPFLRLPEAPWQTAMGGMNASLQTGDAAHSMHNPALITREQHAQVSASFFSFNDAYKAYTATGILHQPDWNINLAAQAFFVDYGELPLADASGNVEGSFRPADMVLQLAASKSYLSRWQGGLTAKWVASQYGRYTAQALAFDVGLHYRDSASIFSAGLVARNMGVQIKSFAGEPESLPLELQAGFTAKLRKAPLAFSLTAHNLQSFYLRSVYTDQNAAERQSGFENVIDHFTIGGHLFLSQHLEATVGYNHLRRQELKANNGAAGLAGFSGGLRVKFEKLGITFARSQFQQGYAQNHIGLQVHLNKLGTGL